MNTIDTIHSLGIIAVTTICTIALRAFPFLLFGGKKEMPKKAKILGDILPPAIMATLVVFCYRNIDFASASHGLPEILAGLLVVILHVWKRNILLSIAAGTVCYMALIQMVFI